jgi:hypothetical protein
MFLPKITNVLIQPMDEGITWACKA